MTACYIVLEEDAGIDVDMDGTMLSNAGEALSRLAASGGIADLMDFFSIDGDELEEFDVPTPRQEEQWFDALEGLKTIRALREAVAAEASFPDADGVLEDLRDCAAILEQAAEKKVRWHLAIDY